MNRLEDTTVLARRGPNYRVGCDFYHLAHLGHLLGGCPCPIMRKFSASSYVVMGCDGEGALFNPPLVQPSNPATQQGR